MRAIAIALLAAGCSGGGPAQPTGPKQSPVEERKAEREAAGLVGEVYATIGRGDTKDGLFSLLAEPLAVFGPRRTDAFANRADALVALGEIIDPRARRKRPMLSGALAVVAAPGGRSAWAFDVVNAGGESFALTAILSNADDLWLIDAVALARMPSRGAIAGELARDAVVPPGAIAKANVDPAVRGAVDKFTRGLLDQRAWGDELTSHGDGIVVGPTAGEVARGKKQIKKLWQKRLDANVRAAASGEITADVTADGQLAWVTAPVTRVGDREAPLPLRAFAVFERAGSGWTLMALHESLAVDAPGAGTSFKKVVPPALAPPPKADEPPKAVKGKKGKAGGEPKKKKKRRAEAADGDGEERPSKRKLADAEEEEAEESEAPRKRRLMDLGGEGRSKQRRADAEAGEDGDGERPAKKQRKRAVHENEDEDEEEKPRTKQTAAAEEDEERPSKRKRKRSSEAEDEDEPKKKKKKKKKPAPAEDEVEIEDE